MKIVHLIYSLCSGGAERFVVSLANQQVAMGHDVSVCILLSDTDENYTFNLQFLDSAVGFHSFGFTKGFSIRKSNIVENYLDNLNPDVVHCHLNVIPYIYRLAFRRRKINFVHTLHSVAANASGKFYQYPFNYLSYRFGLIKPIAISEKCAESYVQYYGLRNPACIDNGCEQPRMSQFYQQTREEIEGYKYTEGTSVFVHVARFHSLKNQKLLIESFNRIRQEGYDAILLMIGDGFNEGEGRKLKEQACDAIHFLGLKSNVGDYLMCADAFCLSSIYEGLPISLLEAMACGVVPICTKVGGISDVIEDGKTGILSDVDTSAYTEAMERFFSTQIDKSLIQECYRMRFSMAACALKYYKIYIENI